MSTVKGVLMSLILIVAHVVLLAAATMLWPFGCVLAIILVATMSRGARADSADFQKCEDPSIGSNV